MSDIQAVSTAKAPAAIGPYSQALATESLVFTSGQLPLKDGAMPDGVREQTAQCLENIRAILEAAGSGLGRVLKCTVFLADINDFTAMNEVYAAHFAEPYPARSAFAVKDLPKGARVEIEAVAAR